MVNNKPKKDHEVMNEEVPKIKPTFIKTMVEEYGQDIKVVEAIADDFIQVFIDSADYSFSLNHAQAYSYLGAIVVYLRTYYPLEFTAAALAVWKKGEKNVKILDYATSKGFTIKPARFRKAKGEYFADKETNTIYSGTNHIKGGNTSVGDTLYTLRDRDYPTFTDLVIDVIENGQVTYEGKTMSVQEFYRTYDDMKSIDKSIKADSTILERTSSPLGINKTKMEGLIRLDYFEEFGKAKKLMAVYEYVAKKYKPSNKTYSGKRDKYFECIEYEKSLPNEEYSVVEKCENELELTGRVTMRSEKIPSKYAFVTKIENIGKTRTTATVYSINKGVSTEIKAGSAIYRDAPFKEGDLIELQEMKVVAKRVLQDGNWIASPTEKELWVKQLKFIRKTKIVTKKGK